MLKLVMVRMRSMNLLLRWMWDLESFLVGLDLCYEKLFFIVHIEKIAIFFMFELHKRVFHSLDLNPSGNRRFSILVSQLNCNDANIPPDGCLQYFRGTTGRISIFLLTKCPKERIGVWKKKYILGVICLYIVKKERYQTFYQFLFRDNELHA